MKSRSKFFMKIKDLKVLATVFEGNFNIIKSNNLKGKEASSLFKMYAAANLTASMH